MLIERKPQMKTLRNLKDQNIIKVITGVRRCGKSTLLQMFADELLANGVTEKQIQILNFDDPELMDSGTYLEIYRRIVVELDPDRMNYVFLDEVQNIDQFEKMVEGFQLKKNVDVYITGSNSKMLSGELATLLTGRYITIEMLPYSYSEYLEALSNSENLSKPTPFRNSFDAPKSPNLSSSASLGNFLYDGSLPQGVHLGLTLPEQRDIFVENVLRSIIERDIFSKHEIYTKDDFNKVTDFLFDTVGSEVSPSSIANSLSEKGINVDKKTVSKYIEYLTDALVLYEVPRYDIRGKRLLKTLSKYYLIDTGFRKSRLSKGLNDDRGHLLENAVYFELRRRNRRVWVGSLRQGEIDFVVEDKKGYISYYQVAYSTAEQSTLERELAPLKAIRSSDRKYLLTADFDIDPVFDGIRKYNVERWLRGEYSE